MLITSEAVEICKIIMKHSPKTEEKAKSVARQVCDLGDAIRVDREQVEKECIEHTSSCLTLNCGLGLKECSLGVISGNCDQCVE